MKRIVMLSLVAAAVFVAGCTDPQKATRILTDQGYMHIEVTGYKAFACSDDDIFQTGFRAMSPSGREVSGVVCSGLFKGSTIRFD